KRVAGLERGHGHHLLAQVGIHRSVPRHRSRQILHRARGRGDRIAAGLEHSDDIDVEVLIAGGVGDRQLPKAVYGRGALDANAHVERGATGAVQFKPGGAMQALNDVGLAGQIALRVQRNEWHECETDGETPHTHFRYLVHTSTTPHPVATCWYCSGALAARGYISTPMRSLGLYVWIWSQSAWKPSM